MQLGIRRPIVKDYEVLDDFQRTDTLNHGNWTANNWLATRSVTCSAGVATATGVASALWNVFTVNPPCEVSAVLPSVSDDPYLCLFTDLTNVPSGYVAELNSASPAIRRIDTGTLTILTSTSFLRTAGARCKFSISSNGLLSCSQAGTVFLTTTSTTYTGPFYLGLAIGTNTTQMKLFGGGGR